MTSKRVTAILHGCDRNLWQGGPLKVRISDLFAAGGPKLKYEGEIKGSSVEFKLELPFDAGQVYGLLFAADDHRPAWQLLRHAEFVRQGVERDDLILRLMLVPDSPGTSDLPNGLQRLQQRGSPLADAQGGLSDEAFNKLPVAAQMAFLNIEAKLRETYVEGASLLSFVRAVNHVAVDRLFIQVDAALKDRVARAADFAGAAGHNAPRQPPGLPNHPDSWKHRRYGEGNVQLSFSSEAMALSGGGRVHSVDVDIDLAKGLAHVVEWLENNVFRPGHKTDQAIVYGQLYGQGLYPDYALDPLPATTERAFALTRARLRPVRAAKKREPARPRARPRKAPARRRT
jgi:hypothetical protein